MILLDVRDYLKAAGNLAVRDVSLHFNISQHGRPPCFSIGLKKGMQENFPLALFVKGAVEVATQIQSISTNGLKVTKAPTSFRFYFK